MNQNALKLLSLLFFLSFYQINYGQEVSCFHGEDEKPHHHEPPSPEMSGEECFDKCENWNAPKVINLHFHVLQDENGQHNFSPLDYPWFEDLVATANARLAANTSSASIIDAQVNLSFQIDNITYHQTDDWCNPGGGTYYTSVDTDVDGALNVVMLENCQEWMTGSCSGCPGGWVSTLGTDELYMHRSYYRHINNLYSCDEFEQRANLLIHEAGHALSLRHSFSSDGCDDTNSEEANFMSWNPCGNAYFTCCQVDKIHDFIHDNSSGIADYVYTPNPSVCSASFELEEVNSWCTVNIHNTSTSSLPSSPLSATWCVDNLSDDDPAVEYTTYDLSFDAASNTEYEICLCVSDENGCETYTCKIMDFSPEPVAQLVDANGDPKTVFCYGEDVYLDASASMFYNQYFISVWEIDDNGQTLNYSRFEDWWQPGQVPSPFNISAYDWFPSNDWIFCPNSNYRIQFALKNSCVGWTAIDLDFEVRCCDDQFDPYFELEAVNTNGSNYDIVPVNQQMYQNSPANCPVTQTWCVYAKESIDGTYEIVASGEGPDFSYSAENGLFYRVVQNVSTPCGDYCYACTICRGCFRDSGSRALGCGPTECPSDCQAISPPNYTDCSKTSQGLALNWASVPNATAYEIIISPGDCCDQPFQGYSIQVTNNFFVLPSNMPDCFSWKVRTVGPGGMTSDFTDPVCMDENSDCLEIVDPTNCSVLPSQPEINCSTNQNGAMVLDWTATPSAIAYNVIIDFQDNNCCQRPFTKFRYAIYQVSTNQLTLPPGFGGCFSFRIEAICENYASNGYGPSICVNQAGNCQGEFQDGNIPSEDSEAISTKKLQVFPNPAKASLNVQFKSDLSETILLQLHSTDGKLVQSQQIELIKGINIHTLDTSILVGGIYFLKVHSSQEDHLIKVIILN